MDKYTNNEKIKLIKKYFKKDYTFLELSLKNYESYNIYIILTFNKKMKYYRLYWFDLSLIIDDKIEKYIEFLKASGRDYPLEVLKIIDVDLTDTKVFDEAMHVFRKTLDEFIELSK